MNTQDRRASAINIGSPWRGLFPLPDGLISGADFRHIAFLYRGIGAEDVGPSARLPDGRRWFGTPEELQRYISRLPKHVYAPTDERKPRRKRRHAKLEPLELVPDFDPPPAPYKLTPDDVSVARRRIAAEAAMREATRIAELEEQKAIVLLLLVP